MVSNAAVENRRYKLLGFENDKSLAVVMIVSTGKIIKIKLISLLKSEIMDDFNKAETRSVYRKFYSREDVLTSYDISDRHEGSWAVYVVLNLLLFALGIFTNVAAAKLVYLEYFDVVVTPGAFLYPLTFLIVDLLNEFYGLRLARKAILFVFVNNAFLFALLTVTNSLPGSPGWRLDGVYSEMISHVSSVMVASSIAFLVSEYLNSYLLCRIKELTSSRFLFLRVFFSSLFAMIIDSFVFCFIAFYGVVQNDDILNFIYIQIAIKMCFAVMNVFPAYGARAMFRRYVANVQYV